MSVYDDMKDCVVFKGVRSRTEYSNGDYAQFKVRSGTPLELIALIIAETKGLPVYKLESAYNNVNICIIELDCETGSDRFTIYSDRSEFTIHEVYAWLDTRTRMKGISESFPLEDGYKGCLKNSDMLFERHTRLWFDAFETIIKGKQETECFEFEFRHGE